MQGQLRNQLRLLKVKITWKMPKLFSMILPNQ